jgi:NDP-sugar pyrophosphorylase family protein
MKTECCLIAVGGYGRRLKNDGIEFPYSKSSLQLLGKPMLYWLLGVLEEVGIRKIVMTSERKDSLEFARRVSDDFVNNFDRITFHQNLGFGFGFYGLPFQCKDFIGFPCFLEAGHSFNAPEHYEEMDRKYEKGHLLASSFPSKGLAPRHVIKTEGGKMKYGNKISISGEMEIGSPILFGEDYVDMSQKLDFYSNKIFPHYIKDNKLKLIPSCMPLEADVKKEWYGAIPTYEKFIRDRKYSLII